MKSKFPTEISPINLRFRSLRNSTLPSLGNTSILFLLLSVIFSTPLKNMLLNSIS